MYARATLVALCLAATSAHAGELLDLEGQSIDLGDFHGIVYYTSDDDGFRVVTTIAEGEAGQPVRFVATLADRQALALSVPGRLGEPAQELNIWRDGDSLLVGPQSDGPTLTSAR
jgi:hypothetical protein